MKERAKFIEILINSLEEIREPRLFQSERGYQGELLSELKKRLEAAGFPGDPIVEQEYQKRLKVHGINIRPDLIVHIPFDRGAAGARAEGNFVAIEIKRRATQERARGDFENLELIANELHYPLTVFINIDASQTYAEICPAAIAKQTVCFAVELKGCVPVVTVQNGAEIL